MTLPRCAALAFAVAALAACNLPAPHPHQDVEHNRGHAADAGEGEGEGFVGEGEGEGASAAEGEGEGEGAVTTPPGDPDGAPLPSCNGEPAPTDPGASVAGWSAVGGSVVDDGGGVSVVFASNAVCGATAEARVTAAMPSCYLPLALAITVTVDGTTLDDSAVLFGGAPLDFHYEQGQPALRCLGERAFGGARDIVVRPRDFESCTSSTAEMKDVHLEENDACPAPGSVVPLSAFALSASQDKNASATIDASGAVDLVTVGSCDQAQATGPAIGAVSFPDTVGVGLSVHVEGDASFAPLDPDDGQGGHGLYAVIGGFGVFAPLAHGDNIICVPRGMRGTAQRLTFVLSAGDGTCADPDPQHAIISDVAVVSGVCDDVDVVDGSFDRAQPEWLAEAEYPPSASVTFANGTATLIANNECDAPFMTGDVSVPAAVTGSGPAVQLHYRATGAGQAYLRLEDFAANIDLPLSSSTATARMCLPPSRIGEIVRISIGAFGTTGGGGACSNPLPQGIELAVDDVTVVLDPACPAP